MIRGIEAKWHGLNRTLTIPHKKHPTAAMVDPLAIHSLTVKTRESSIRLFSL
jgi:hypothetical protein